MKNNRILALVLALMLAITGCMPNNSATKTEVTETQNQVETMQTQYSTGFEIEYVDKEQDIKKITDGENNQYLLVPEGVDVPEEYKDMAVVSTPIDNVLFGSTTTVGQLKPLDIWDSIAGVTSDQYVWHIPEVLEGLESGTITYVGDDYAPDREMIQNLNPTIAIVYTGVAPQTQLIEVLDDLEIPYIVDNSYMEEDPRGRMEWIKLLASLYNKEEEGAEYFNAQLETLEELEEKLQDVDRPSVVYGSVYDGLAYVPLKDSYVGHMIDMTKGSYVFDYLEEESTGQLSLEDFFVGVSAADLMIYSASPEYVPTYNDMLLAAPILEDAPVVENNMVWQVSGDYWQNNDLAHEQIVDLAAIIHPEIFPDRDITHFVPMAR